MKAVPAESSAKAPQLPFTEMLTAARTQETAGELKGAAAAYLRCLQLRPVNELCYNRLMIIYRKQKLYSKEAGIIARGIKTFQTLHKGKKRRNTRVQALSKTLLKSTGLVDAKGNSTFNFEPVQKWKQRLLLLEERYLSK